MNFDAGIILMEHYLIIHLYFLLLFLPCGCGQINSIPVNEDKRLYLVMSEEIIEPSSLVWRWKVEGNVNDLNDYHFKIGFREKPGYREFVSPGSEGNVVLHSCYGGGFKTIDEYVVKMTEKLNSSNKKILLINIEWIDRDNNETISNPHEFIRLYPNRSLRDCLLQTISKAELAPGRRLQLVSIDIGSVMFNFYGDELSYSHDY